MPDYDYLPEVEPPDDDRVSIISTSEIARQQAGGYLYAAGVSLPDEVTQFQVTATADLPVIDHVRQSVFMNIGRKLWSLMPFILDGSWSQSGDGQWHLAVVVDPANAQHYSINLQYPAIIGAPGPQGVQGIQGVQGNAGAPGADGPTHLDNVITDNIKSQVSMTGNQGVVTIANFTVPQSKMAAGLVLHLRLIGAFTLNAAHQLVININHGAVGLASGGTSGSMTSGYFDIDLYITVRDLLAAGHVQIGARYSANTTYWTYAKDGLAVPTNADMNLTVTAQVLGGTVTDTVKLVTGVLETIGA